MGKVLKFRGRTRAKSKRVKKREAQHGNTLKKAA